MILSRKDLIFYVKADAKANLIVSSFDYLIKILYGNVHACSFRYLKSLRLYEYYLNRNRILRFWYRFYNRRLGLKYNLSIIPNTVGPGLSIPHIEGGVIINCLRMGKGCTVNAGVVVGNKSPILQQERPSIGDNVVLCVGCKVIGGVIIGDNVVVAPNAVVVKDVPDNAIVTGVPASVLKSRMV